MSQLPSTSETHQPGTQGHVQDGKDRHESTKTRMNRVISIEEPNRTAMSTDGKSSDVDDASGDGSRRHRHHHISRATKHLVGHLPHRTKHDSLHSSPSIAPTQQSDESAPANDQGRHLKDTVDQITQWLYAERQRRHHRKSRTKHSRKDGTPDTHDGAATNHKPSEHRRTNSDDSDSSVALDRLERIIKATPSLTSLDRRLSARKSSRRLKSSASSIASVRNLRRPSAAFSSDTDHHESEMHVPECDVYLDNTKTLASTGKHRASQINLQDANSPVAREDEPWLSFKYEIVRLTHTLRFRGWRRVSLDNCGEIEVDRLSGALTNAVYVVSPPADVPASQDISGKSSDRPTARPVQKTAPPKLLLRIYGPQVEHLIDRENEIQLLRRLCRKNIGPRLLGLFRNGRFEEYLHAQPLKPKDLRTPEVSKQIAKRMRELHDGIELLQEERDAGPFMWRNWDKWFNRCERIVTHLDRQVLHENKSLVSNAKPAQHLLVLGVEWRVFKETVARYRRWVEEQYNGPEGVKAELLFAHNDTQYGNILRLEPSGKSPLLLPANEHKQLVVIDFEYANANPPGIEFANHFTEWCYDYHHPTLSFMCNTKRYPTLEEQRRFLHAYVQHQPQFTPATASTPRFSATRPSFSFSNNPSISSINTARPTMPHEDSLSSTFTLGPPVISEEPDQMPPSASGQDPSSQESKTSPGRRETTDGATTSTTDEIQRLLAETRLWRPANTAQWVAWGIMQAHVPGLESPTGPSATDKDLDGADTIVAKQDESEEGQEASQKPQEEEKNGDHAEFDYLSYARERALFFWGDMVQMGFIAEEELPKDVRSTLKTVVV